MADPKKGMNVTDEPPKIMWTPANDDDWDAAAAGDDEDDLSDLDDMEF